MNTQQAVAAMTREARFMLVAKLQSSSRQEGECFVWIKYCDKYGYGSTRVGGKMVLAHRLVWIIAHGFVPTGLCVLHRCDNPPCIRLDHLWLGSHTDNMKDMARKQRGVSIGRPGEAHPMAKITEKDVSEIRSRYASGGITLSSLGMGYGVSKSNISLIVNGTTWSHLNLAQKRKNENGTLLRSG